jgi:hypothetical protein
MNGKWYGLTIVVIAIALWSGTNPCPAKTVNYGSGAKNINWYPHIEDPAFWDDYDVALVLLVKTVDADDPAARVDMKVIDVIAGEWGTEITMVRGDFWLATDNLLDNTTDLSAGRKLMVWRLKEKKPSGPEVVLGRGPTAVVGLGKDAEKNGTWQALKAIGALRKSPASDEVLEAAAVDKNPIVSRYTLNALLARGKPVHDPQYIAKLQKLRESAAESGLVPPPAAAFNEAPRGRFVYLTVMVGSVAIAAMGVLVLFLNRTRKRPRLARDT